MFALPCFICLMADTKAGKLLTSASSYLWVWVISDADGEYS